MNEEDLRDCFAMFAIVGLLNRGDTKNLRAVTELAYECADNMLEARKPTDEIGIAAIKPRPRKRV
jgi:hypothetical protein